MSHLGSEDFQYPHWLQVLLSWLTVRGAREEFVFSMPNNSEEELEMYILEILCADRFRKLKCQRLAFTCIGSSDTLMYSGHSPKRYRSLV